MIDKEDVSPISNVQLMNILCHLGRRIEKLEEVLLQFYEAVMRQDEFLTNEVLKARLDLVLKDNKTPYKRLLELEQKVTGNWESFEGFVSGYYEDKKPKRGRYLD